MKIDRSCWIDIKKSPNMIAINGHPEVSVSEESDAQVSVSEEPDIYKPSD